MRGNMRKQAVAIGREAEKPAFLHCPFHRGALGRKLLPALTRDQLGFVVIGFVTDRIPAFVSIKIEIAIGLHPPPQFLRGGMVARLCGAQEYIIADVERGAHILEILRHFIGKRAR